MFLGVIKIEHWAKMSEKVNNHHHHHDHHNHHYYYHHHSVLPENDKLLKN